MSEMADQQANAEPDGQENGVTDDVEKESGGGEVEASSRAEAVAGESGALESDAVETGAADLKVRRVIVETLTQEELDYFRSIRDYLSTLKQPDREKWIIHEMQKFRAEVEEERRSSDAILPPISMEEKGESLEGGSGDNEFGPSDESASPRLSDRKTSSAATRTSAAADIVSAEAVEEEEQLTEEEKAFLAFQADEAKKCQNCNSYCHMEGDEDYLYLPCTLCEKRICHLCKRFCYKCGELVCVNCIFTKPKTGRKYCPRCFNDTRLNDRVLKCEICFLKVEIDERIISCWRCYSVACMKTCGRYSVDGFICRRCIGELKEQEERNREAEDDEDLVAEGFGDDGNINMKSIKVSDFDFNMNLNKWMKANRNKTVISAIYQ